MFFVDHNFLESYSTAFQYKDKSLLADIISSEIAKIIVDNKKKLIDITRKYKIVSNSVTDSDLANIVTNKELLSRPEFLKDFSILILNEAPVTNPSNSLVSSVCESLKELSSSDLLTKNTVTHLQTVETQIQQTIDKNKSVGLKLKHVLVFAALVGLGYFLYKQILKEEGKFEAPKFEDGGNIPPNPAAPVVQPTPTPQPVIQTPTPEIKNPEIV